MDGIGRDGWMGGWMGGWMDGWMNRHSMVHHTVDYHSALKRKGFLTHTPQHRWNLSTLYCVR
jgi:hypothetical protein